MFASLGKDRSCSSLMVSPTAGIGPAPCRRAQFMSRLLSPENVVWHYLRTVLRPALPGPSAGSRSDETSRRNLWNGVSGNARCIPRAK